MKVHSVVLAAVVASFPALADSVVTYHNSNQRDGAYTIPGLTLSTAANMQRDTKFDGTISGHVYAQPLFWKPKGAKHGLVIVATESNTVYALNDSSGKVVWNTTLADPVMPLNQLPLQGTSIRWVSPGRPSLIRHLADFISMR